MKRKDVGELYSADEHPTAACCSPAKRFKQLPGSPPTTTTTVPKKHHHGEQAKQQHHHQQSKPLFKLSLEEAKYNASEEHFLAAAAAAATAIAARPPPALSSFSFSAAAASTTPLTPTRASHVSDHAALGHEAPSSPTSPSLACSPLPTPRVADLHDEMESAPAHGGAALAVWRPCPCVLPPGGHDGPDGRLPQSDAEPRGPPTPRCAATRFHAVVFHELQRLSLQDCDAPAAPAPAPVAPAVPAPLNATATVPADTTTAPTSPPTGLPTPPTTVPTPTPTPTSIPTSIPASIPTPIPTPTSTSTSNSLPCQQHLPTAAVAGAVPYSCSPGEVPLFHLAQLAPDDPIVQEIAAETAGMDFEPICVLQVQNPILRAQFAVHRAALTSELGEDTTRVLYHATMGNLFDICQNGLSCRYSRGGFFGRGIYLSDSPLKAHGYARNRDDPDGIKVLLRCHAVLGRVKAYDRLRFERDLVRGPPGYHSVSGYISLGTEYAVYTDEHVLVSEILLYRCRKPGPMMQHVAVPIGDQLVLISRAVLAFAIRQLSLITTHSPVHTDVARRLLLALVTRRIPLEQFFQDFSPIAGGPPPQALRDVLAAELAVEIE